MKWVAIYNTPAPKPLVIEQPRVVNVNPDGWLTVMDGAFESVTFKPGEWSGLAIGVKHDHNIKPDKE